MRSQSVMQRLEIAVLLACTALSGGCATLDRDPANRDFEARKASFWVQPPSETGDTPVFGINIPW